MTKSQSISGQFRRKRMLIAVVIAFLVLALTLFLRFIEEKRRVEHYTAEFASKAIERFDRLFSPLDLSGDKMLNLSQLNCEQVHSTLLEEIARLQTLRSIILVKDDRMFCSSVFGESNSSFSQLFPELASGQQTMLLSTDFTLLRRGSPILLLWHANADTPRSGVLQIVNIDMMINYLLEPMPPWVERTVFNVSGQSLEYGNPLIEPVYPSDDEVEQYITSPRYPYSVTLFGPSSFRLALLTAPSQLPLALLLGLLIGYIAWLAIANRISLAGQITHGINAQEFKVYCQPLINSQTAKCEGIEILLRWYSPRQGWIPPDVFIPIAEQHQLIIPLTRYVLHNVAGHLSLLPKSKEFHIAINVTASHFENQQIIRDLESQWWPAQPEPQLVLELTERESVPQIDHHVVNLLHDIDVKLAIDDFGTGHSSLSYLKTLNPDILKIDKVFTAAVGNDAINATVTDMVISLAQKLNISMVAEGVETAAQVNYMRQMGVEVLQGYFFSHPMPLGIFPQWLEEYHSKVQLTA